MILYHGSNVEVREPHLLKIQRDLDFGKGFYTTSDPGQAVNWAKRTARIRGTGKPCVSVYDISDSKMEKLKIRRFAAADQAWLDYVAMNRRGNAAFEEADLVIGPVANDQTFPTILLYLDGYISAETAIQNLLTQKLKDQYTFKTDRALALLRCTGVMEV